MLVAVLTRRGVVQGVRGEARTGEFGVEMELEFCGSASEAANEGVKGDGERLDADLGENVNTEGLVLRDMNKGGGFGSSFELSSSGCDFEHDIEVILRRKMREIISSIATGQISRVNGYGKMS